jgi:hypothetical protein
MPAFAITGNASSRMRPFGTAMMIGADMMARALLVRCNKGKLLNMSETVREAFRKQAAGCRMLQSPFTADVLETLADGLDSSTQTGRHILAWSGSPLHDALPLRIAGGLHALARRGDDPALSALYRAGQGDFALIIADAIAAYDDWLCDWLDSPPQTNEVGRSGALMAGLMVASNKLACPLELLELGSSAGLNLNLDRFHYQFGALACGPADSPVRIAPHWTGPSPPDVAPSIVSRAGVDIRPLDVREDAVAERLIAYVWPDQTDRMTRTEAAISLARAFPPPVSAGDAGAWIAQKLAEEQVAGTARIIMHSVFWQYLPSETQTMTEVAMNAAAANAKADRPLGWLSFEPGENLQIMTLRLRLWPAGDDLVLANCHPHGTVIEWLGL